MTRFNKQTPPPSGGVCNSVPAVPAAPAVPAVPENPDTPTLPVPCRSMAWFLNDQRRPEQAQVSRIEITHIAKPNVYGNECPWTERIIYYVGHCQRNSTEVFATKEELINSLMQ